MCTMARRLLVATVLLLAMGAATAHAQQEDSLQVLPAVGAFPADGALLPDSAQLAAEVAAAADSAAQGVEAAVHADSARLLRLKPKRDWATWHPKPQRALWLALVLPGAGQIYNRKYWKLPIFYGGIMGCLYAMNWNNMMYKSYSQAYLDIMDSDPGTASYNQFMHLGRQINSSNEARYKSLFKSRKDKYRRWRDLSFFVLVGVYALSVIDAYVDAELSEFDISKDLSLRVQPVIINSGVSANVLESTAFGLQCHVTF